MGHLLSSVNADAAARIGRENDPLPEVGTMVHYRPRPTDVKRGRWVVPAIVLTADHDNRTLDLFVIYDANDQITQERVPESPGEHERGWARIPSQTIPAATDAGEVAALRADLEALRKQTWGDYELDDESLADAVKALDDRVAKLEKATAKGKPGRPKGSTKPKPAIVPDAA